jgi:hypothetical protein
MSLNSFALKGGGWYATDYAKPSPKKEDGAAKKTDAPSGADAGPKAAAPATPPTPPTPSATMSSDKS